MCALKCCGNHRSLGGADKCIVLLGKEQSPSPGPALPSHDLHPPLPGSHSTLSASQEYNTCQALAHTSSLSYSGGRGKKNTLSWDLDSHLGYIVTCASKKKNYKKLNTEEYITNPESLKQDMKFYVDTRAGH